MCDGRLKSAFEPAVLEHALRHFVPKSVTACRAMLDLQFWSISVQLLSANSGVKIEPTTNVNVSL